jgi:FAD synthetase
MTKNLKTVLVAGTFDILHPGHVNLFEQAKQYGERLVVIVARDKTVEQVKGKKPLHPEKVRLAQVSSQELVDQVVLGQLGNPVQTVAKLSPDVVALGYDQKAFTQDLKKQLTSYGCHTKVVRLKPFKPEKYKSSMFK